MFLSFIKRSRALTMLLLLLILSSLLIGCADNSDVSEPNTPGTTRKVSRQVPTIQDDTPTAALPTPTPAPMEPTVTPLSSPQAVPPVQPGVTPGSSQITPGQGDDEVDALGSVAEAGQGGVASSQNVDGTARSGGLPKLPVIDSQPPAAQGTNPGLKSNYGSKGQPKVGIQAGHWQIEALPDEFASLRGQTGGSGGGVREVDLTVDLARRVASLLQSKGYEVDLLPATVPTGYTADAFVSIHADASSDTGPSGYKIARSRFSAIPFTDDALMNAVYASYGRATGMTRDGNITRNMTGYYAFNSRRRTHAVSKVTPAIIVETGYLTNAADRSYLTTHQDNVADGIARGIISFLEARPPLENREKAAQSVPGVEVTGDRVPILDKPDGSPIAYATKGQQFESRESTGEYYAIFAPAVNKPGYLRRSDVKVTTLPR